MNETSQDPEASARLKDLVLFVARALVDEPDAVEVEEVEEGRGMVLELTVAEPDLGKVIGRQGRTARALRTVLSAAAAKLQTHVALEILE